MPVSKREPEARGPVSVFVLPSKSEALCTTMTFKRCDDFTCSQRTSWQTWSGQNFWKLCF